MLGPLVEARQHADRRGAARRTDDWFSHHGIEQCAWSTPQGEVTRVSCLAEISMVEGERREKGCRRYIVFRHTGMPVGAVIGWSNVDRQRQGWKSSEQRTTERRRPGDTTITTDRQTDRQTNSRTAHTQEVARPLPEHKSTLEFQVRGR